jgi:hypothetical protein
MPQLPDCENAVNGMKSRRKTRRTVRNTPEPAVQVVCALVRFAEGTTSALPEGNGRTPLKLRILRAVPVLLVLGLLVHFLLPGLDTIEVC